MNPRQSKEQTPPKNRLRYNLVVIEALVFILPFFVTLYIFFRNNIFLELSQILIFALVLVLVLAGLIILRKIFDKFIALATIMKEAAEGVVSEPDLKADTLELLEIKESFNNLMNQFKGTTEELRLRVFELLAIKELIEGARKFMDMDDLLRLLLEKAMTVSGSLIGSLVMLQSENKLFSVLQSKGLQPGPENGAYIPVEETLLKSVVSEKKPMLVEDIESDSRTLRPNDPKYGPPSFLSLPIFAGEVLIAVLNLAHKKTQQVFNTNDELVLSTMIAEISFALENARLHSESEKQLQVLEERTTELSETNDQLQQEVIERKNAEEALRKSEKKYRTIIESIEEGYFEANLRGDQTFFNDSTCRILGYPRTELLGMNNRDYTSPQTAKKMYHIFNEIYRTGKPAKVTDYEIIRKDGQTRILEMSTSLMQGASGSPVGFHGVIRDVTERKRAEEELKKSEEQYRDLFENANDLIQIVTPAGNIAKANKKWKETLGYTEEDLAGLSLWDIIHPDCRYDMEEVLKRVFSGETVINIESFFVSKEGKPIPVEGNAGCRFEDEEPVFSISTFRDVSERRKAEEQLRNTCQELEQTRDMLVQSEKLAAIGRLTAGVAHEILNPVNIIGMRLQMLSMTEGLPDKAKETLDICRKQLNRILEITKDLGRFSRIAKKETTMGDLNALIKDILTLCGPQFKEEGIKTEVKLCPELPLIPMDEDKIAQVIFNIISNATSAMSKQPNAVLTIITDQPSPGGPVQAVISDTGPGIKKEDIYRVFDPFFTTKGPNQGTGLGLFISHGIMQEHGGNVWAENNKQGGASFFIELPTKEKTKE